MSIEGCQAELTAHAPTTVGTGANGLQLSARHLPGLLRTNKYQNLAEAPDQGHRHLLRESGVRWRRVYRSHGTALWTCFDQSNRHPMSELFF